MVKFHVKKNDVEFIIEFPLDTQIDIIIENAANISNQIYKLKRICSLLPDLIAHGPFRSEEFRVCTFLIHNFRYSLKTIGINRNLSRRCYSC